MKFFKAWIAGLAVLAFCTAASAAEASNPDLDRRLSEANLILKEIMMAPDQSIPEELFAKCRAIAIYPNVLKGGFIFGAKYGKGVVLARDSETNQWGPAAFSTIGGGSWGLQIGAQATDLILVIMNERGLEGILSSKFTLGADASVAAGPVGRNAEAATDATLRAGVLSYSRSRGLFGGIALDGAVMTQDNNSNSAYYGKETTSRDILQDGQVAIQPSSQELVDSLNDYSSRWPKRTTG